VLGVVSPYGPLSTFLLVVGALGLYTPGPVRLDSVHRPLHCSSCGGFVGPPRPK